MRANSRKSLCFALPLVATVAPQKAVGWVDSHTIGDTVPRCAVRFRFLRFALVRRVGE